MAELPYVLQTVDLDVFGGPSSVDVSTDFGRTGTRGSLFFTGVGPPERTLNSSQNIQVGDLYINSQPGVDYSWLYTYNQRIGAPVWEKTLKLNPTQNLKRYSVAFNSSGEGIIRIPLSSLLDTAIITSPQLINFTITYTIEGQNPIASSFTYDFEQLGSEEKRLKITIKAAQYSGSAWSNLNVTTVVHTDISYIS